MIVNAKDLKKVLVQYEPEEEPGGGTGSFPQPPVDPDWDAIDPDNPDDGEGGSSSQQLEAPVIISTPKSPEEKASEWEEAVRQAGAGTESGLLKELLDDYLAPPIVDWKTLLRKFIGSMVRKEESILPNRRFIGSGDVLWGSKPLQSTFDTLIIIVDTSGSMDPGMLQTCVNETMDIMEKYKPKETYVLWCDNTVYEPVDIIKGKKDYPVLKEAPGRGGTDYRPPFAWIEKNLIEKGKKIGPVIFFGDGFPNAAGVSWPLIEQYQIQRYANKCFWGIVSRKRVWKGDPSGPEPMHSGGVPFGRKIDVVIP